MKKLISFVFAAVAMISCSNDASTRWEYKVVTVEGCEASASDACFFDDQSEMLNTMGLDGWELVSAYTENETRFPNFGKPNIVLGIKPNVRTSTLNFVFKRMLDKDKAEEMLKAAEDTAVVADTTCVDSIK